MADPPCVLGLRLPDRLNQRDVCNAKGFYQVARQLRILYLVPSGPPGTASMVFAHAEIGRIRSSGTVTETIEFQTSARPDVFVRQIRGIRARVGQFRPDIVHAHFGTITAFAAIIASPVPVIITFRGSDLNPSPSDGWLRNIVQKTLSNSAALFASAVILVSRQLRSRLWFRHPNVYLIPTGVDLEVFRPTSRTEARSKLGWDFDTPVVLFNAGLSPNVKRLDLAEQSFGLLRSNFPDVRMHVLRGTTPHQDLPLYMNACDCLFLTSDFEGSPDIIKEALACNLPIVSVDVGDVRERADGVDRVLIVDRDPRALATAAQNIIKDGMRSNGRDKIADLDARRVSEAVIGVYDEILDKSRKTETQDAPGNARVG